MSSIRHIHPFPARMAPDVALKQLEKLPPHTVILDPMMGSGTVLRTAIDCGLRAIGRDVDPLAVLIARVWTTPLDTRRLHEDAHQLVQEAHKLRADDIRLPWIDDDVETAQFIDYWFGERQKADLRKLAYLIQKLQGAQADALRIALSRIIITKNNGASLARDVSHSRPHRVRLENPFPVLDEFLRSVPVLAKRLDSSPLRYQADICQEDARKLASIADASVDVVLTSPPYLNAIDYMRGHRLSLVWLGYQLSELRTIRLESIGSERAPEKHTDISLANEIVYQMELEESLPQREQRMIKRYILDLFTFLCEVHRVLRPGGKAIFVVGNSCLHGVFIKNTQAITLLAQRLGFECVGKGEERELPPNRRYLPPPHASEYSDLKKRMRTETILTFRRLPPLS
jgi:tRNA G10  N-methylase Trm11